MTSTSSVEFNGQVVVISGAATGIGKASAQLIAARGAKVIALDFNAAALNDLAKELNLATNQVHTCDISDQNQIDKAISAILKDHGQIDALINTAGIVGPSNTILEDVKWADFEKVSDQPPTGLDELLAWAADHRAELAQHTLVGTGTTGRLVAEHTGLDVDRPRRHPPRGDRRRHVA